MVTTSAHRPAQSYDAVADRYAEQFADELNHKPMDRCLLGYLAEVVQDRGGAPVWDLGCGPGHAAAHLHRLGADVTGLDLSPALVERARADHPDVAFVVGSMAELPAADHSVGAIVALYSIIHLLDDSAVLAAFAEWRRVLRQDAEVLIAVHEGRRVDYIADWWDVPVALGFRFFEVDELTGLLREAGLSVTAVLRRGPIEDVELPTTRLYLFARPARPEGEA